MKEITIQRPAERWNKSVPYHIYVDGKWKGNIYAGQKLTLQLPDTARSIRSAINWAGSEEELLSNTENIVVKANWSIHQLTFVCALIPIISIGISQFADWQFISYSLLSVMFLLIIAMVTINKNNWLTIKAG